MKDSTLQLLIFTFQSLPWPAQSALYQALRISSKVIALPHAQSAPPADLVRPGAFAVVRVRRLLPLGVQALHGHFRHLRALFMRKKVRRLSVWHEMIGHPKAWRYWECVLRVIVTCLVPHVSPENFTRQRLVDKPRTLAWDGNSSWQWLVNAWRSTSERTDLQEYLKKTRFDNVRCNSCNGWFNEFPFNVSCVRGFFTLFLLFFVLLLSFFNTVRGF